jgi:hypothetical protein
MDKRIFIIGGALLSVVLLLILIITRCRSDEPDAAVDLPDEVERAVKEALSAGTGVPVAEIDVVAAEDKEWSDACLGLAEPDEMCAQVLTSGWEVTARAQGQAYVFHTNKDGTEVRMKK